MANTMAKLAPAAVIAAAILIAAVTYVVSRVLSQRRFCHHLPGTSLTS